MTVLYGPPLVYHRLYHQLQDLRRALSGLHRSIMDWSTKSKSTKVDTKLGTVHQALVRRTLCRRYKETLGLGPKTIYLCRGGSLPEGLLQFLAGFDIVVHTAYGRSECCSLLTSNMPKRFCKLSSVGKPAPGVSVRLGEEGEVQARARSVFMGYLNKEIETRERLCEDGWLRCGDRGTLDTEAFLEVTSCPGEMIHLASGDEVEPRRLEGRVRQQLGCLANCLVVGEDRESLGLLLSLDTELDPGHLASSRLTTAAKQWFQAARFEVATVEEVLEAEDRGIRHVIQAGIDRANLEAENKCEYIQCWAVVARGFSPGAGELGPGGEVRRGVVAERCAKVINTMFTGESRR